MKLKLSPPHTPLDIPAAFCRSAFLVGMPFLVGMLCITTYGSTPALFADEPPQPSIENGDFTAESSTVWKTGFHDKNDFQGHGFDWTVGNIKGWSAYVGSGVEVWRAVGAGGETFVELNNDPKNYGIKQEIKDVKAGSYLLAWKDCGRTNDNAKNESYNVKTYYNNIGGQEQQIFLSKPSFVVSSKNNWTDRLLSFKITNTEYEKAAGSPIYIAFIPLGNLNGYGDLIDKVKLLPFNIETASIRSGQFVINVPDANNGAPGTLDLIILRQGSSTVEVIMKTLTNQSPGRVTITLDDIMNHNTSPLDGHDKQRFDRVKARWRTGNIDVASGDKKLDVKTVEVLKKRKVSNFFSPTWGGNWNGDPQNVGVYPARTYPKGLHDVSRNKEFLNFLDPKNEGLAMNMDTVIRFHIRRAQPDHMRYHLLSGADAYIENPDASQDNTHCKDIALLRPVSVAVRTDADRLTCKDEVYIPTFSVRTVDDSGGLHNNKDQIDVWRGQGDHALKTICDSFGLRNRTCLKIIP